MTDYSSAYALIRRAKKIAIICHINPDADALGSELALYYYLKKAGKTVTPLCDDDVRNRLDFLLEEPNPVQKQSDDKFDLAIAVDCGDLERMGNARVNFVHAKESLIIDHHKTNDKCGEVNIVVPSAAATAQIMFGFLSGLGLAEVDVKIASFLYAGIIADSGGFCYDSTSAETHEVAAELIRLGVDHGEIFYKIFTEKPVEKFSLHSRVLAKTKFYDDGKIAMITFRKEDFEATGTDISHTEGAISVLAGISGVKVSIAITEVGENSYKVSFRSRKNIDVSLAAGEFGGGGHKNASGCRVFGYYEDVVDKLLKAARDVI